MNKMTVWYMNGAGNSFAVVDARKLNTDMSRLAKFLCERGRCDGFMALDNSKIADIRLHFYNRDGSRAEMCGNGARCICRFAYDNKIVGKKMRVETDAGIVEGERISESIYRIRLNTPQGMALNKKDGVDYVTVGVPHLVIKLDELDFADTERLFARAQKLRYELNANVNFYSKIKENSFKILTYERGVEDFTLACGTGSAAVAAALWSKGELSGNSLTVKNKGGELTVTIESRENEITALYLEGSAEVDKIVEY
jgi:diaminopimelate epimerase